MKSKGVAAVRGSTRSRERNGIQSIQRACQVLEVVAQTRDGIGLADLSRRVGLHTSTTFHIAKTLVNLGYLRQLETTRHYRIGRPLFTLAAAAMDEVELVNVAQPLMSELSVETGEATYLAVESGGQLIVIAKQEAPGAIRINDRIGNARPKHCTALGKIMLAAMSEDVFERFLKNHTLDPVTRKSITSPSRLRAEIEEVRRTGAAFDHGEFNEELRCVAVPVFDFTDRVVASLGVSGPAWRVTAAALQRHLHGARRVARVMSSRLGHDSQASLEARSARNRRTFSPHETTVDTRENAVRNSTRPS